VTTCCEANPALTACSASDIKCGPASFKDDLRKDNVVIDHNKTTKCCTNQALCSSMTCAAGKKKIAAAATTYCAGSVCSSIDAATCCETDAAKCLAATPSCPAGQFKDPQKNGVTGATAALCCSNKAKCTTITCGTGQKKKANHATTYCAGLMCGTTADKTACCENDAAKCRGNTCISCVAGTFKDPAKWGATPGNNAQTACCSTLKSCSFAPCLAGQKKKSGYCAGTTCANSDRATCCEDDATKCKGATVDCGTNMYKDKSKNGTSIGCDKKANCCSYQARCSTLACPAGKQLKDNAYDLYCATSTCGGTADIATCCDPDASVCAGATVSCGTGKFKDGSKGAEPVTDAKTKCCTARTKCLPARPVTNSSNTATTSGAPRISTTSAPAIVLALMALVALVQ
jgi:hypothetical protein